LGTDASALTREGIFHTRNSHFYAEENPYLVRQQHFQWRLAVNVWVCVIDGYVVGPFLGFPRVLVNGHYLNFLQNELPILLEDVPLHLRHQMIFQYDEAPPNFSVEVLKYLDETFPV